MKMGQPGVPTYTQFLADLPSGTVVSFDPTLFGAQTVLDMRKTLESKGVNLTSLKQNLIDDIWIDRPPLEVYTYFGVIRVPYLALTSFSFERNAVKKDTSK